MSESTAGNQPRGLEQKWKVLISIMFGIFMIILDATVVNVAFPTFKVLPIEEFDRLLFRWKLDGRGPVLLGSSEGTTGE